MSDNLRVLIIEDSEDDTLLVVRELQRAGYDLQYKRVDTLADMQAALHEAHWDIVIADYSLPNFSGLAALKLMLDSGFDLPFILVSGTIGEELAVAAMKAGAHDYLMKDDLVRLAPAVQRELVEAQGRQAHRKAEEELRRLKEFNEEIVQNVFDGIIVEDASGAMSYVNPALARMLGYTPDELIGQSWTLIVPLDQQAAVQAATERRKQGLADRYELEMVRKDNACLSVLVSGAPRFLEGSYIGSLAVISDITERKRMVDELRKLKEFNEGIIQNMYEGVGIQDEQGRFTFVNPAMADMLGYTPEELIGMHSMDSVPPDQYPIAQAADERYKQGKADRYELELLRKDGKRITVEISGSPQYENGRFSGALVVFTDISARKQAEDTLRRRAEELAALHAASLTITAPHDLRSLVHSIIEQAKHLVNASGGGISLCDPLHEEIRVYEEYTDEGHHYSGMVLKYGEGAAGLVAQTGKPLIIDDYRAWPNRAAIYEQDKPYISTLSVPLLWHGQVTGVLQMTSHIETRLFSQADLELLSLFADQAAIAIENVRLLEAERTIREQAETLRETAQILSASLDLNEVLHVILGQLKRVLTFNTASVFLYGTGGQSALVAGVGFEDEFAISQAAQDLLKPSPILKRMSEDLQPVVIGDVRENPDWIWVPGAEHVRSFLCAPILLRGKMAGALMVDNVQEDFFTDDDVRVVQTLAQHMSIAVQNARLFEAERNARERAEALREAASIIGSMLSLDQVLQAVLEQLARVLPFDSGCIMLIENEQIVIKVWRGFETYADPQMIQDIYFDLETDQTCGEVVRSGKPIVIRDTHHDGRWILTPVGEHVNSWLGVPLRVRDQVIGLFSLDRTSLEGFSEEEVAIAQTFATHASTAIDNARLFEAEEQRAVELLGLRQASLSVTASLELEQVLYTILVSALGFLPGAGNAQIYLYHADSGGNLTFGAALWSEERRGEAVKELQPNDLTYTVARSGEAVVVNDIHNHALYAQALPDGQGAIVGLPLKIGQRVVGVMNISYPHQHRFTEAEMRVLGLLGDQAAIAIENARLFERAATERRHLGLLYDLGRELAATLQSNEILSRAITLTCQAFGGMVGEAFLYIPAENHLSLRALYGRQISLDGTAESKIHLKVGAGLAGWVAQQRTPVSVPDVTQDEHWLYVPELDEEVRSAIVAPIMDNERLLGVLAVLHRQVGAFSDDHLDLLQAICHQVGLALSNAESYTQVQSLVDLLAAEQYRLESLIERLPVGVLLLDAEYRLLIANLLGRQILAQLNPREPGEVITQLGSYAVADLCNTFSVIDPSKDILPVEIVSDGPPRAIIEAEARPIGGDTRQWVITLRDVTQERENQERIRLQERLATVGQLAAGIAHDFNNIMAAILVYTDLLMGERGLPPDSRERLMIIQQQVQRATSLIRQILDFSRRSMMEQQPMDLLPFVKELDKLLSRVLPETIRLDLKYQPGSYMINGDPTRLQQVFMNLALNARDAMPEGGSLRFELSTFNTSTLAKLPHPELPPGEWICITVADTGHGISSEILPHVFDPFFTTKAVGRGTGLGLAQVYGIVRQHQGYIDVASHLGAGTEFLIYLPALESHDEQEGSKAMPDQFDGKGITVLVVEDDQATRDALRALLQAQNFSVMTASNGNEALRIFEQKEGSISFVVADVVMPEMGGLTLHQILRERWQDVKMLFVTGHPLEMRDQALLEKGDVNWLQKPFSIQEFNYAVQALLKR
jgi:PAS domain S-box-containing protein